MAYAAVSGQPVPPMPARVSAWGVYHQFDVLDGERVFVGVTSDKQWLRFCEAFERPDLLAYERLATNNGRFAQIAPDIPAETAKEVFDGANLLAFPGVVDAHTHVGIYQPLAEDAITKSKAAVIGGVTATLTYFRTGENYLNKGAPYKQFFPEVLDISQGKYWVDYGYHLAPINKQHIAEMPMLMEEFGVSSFKVFMFYGGHVL